VNTNSEGLSLQPNKETPAGEAYSTNSWWYDEDANVSLIALPIKEYTLNWDGQPACCDLPQNQKEKNRRRSFLHVDRTVLLLQFKRNKI